MEPAYGKFFANEPQLGRLFRLDPVFVLVGPGEWSSVLYGGIPRLCGIEEVLALRCMAGRRSIECMWPPNKLLITEARGRIRGSRMAREPCGGVSSYSKLCRCAS